MASDRPPLAEELNQAVEFLRQEWAPFAATEPDWTAWLKSAIDRRVIRRE